MLTNYFAGIKINYHKLFERARNLHLLMRGEKSIHSHSLSLPRDYETIRDGFLNSRNLRYFKKDFVGGVGGLIEKLESAKSSVMVK